MERMSGDHNNGWGRGAGEEGAGILTVPAGARLQERKEGGAF